MLDAQKHHDFIPQRISWINEVKDFFSPNLQYYAHRAKLAVIDREKDVEKLNREALRTAREVADNTGTLMAGNISNTTVYNPEDRDWKQKVTAMFKVIDYVVDNNQWEVFFLFPIVQ